MSDLTGASSREFGYQAHDQTGGASHHHAQQQLYGGYGAELDENAPVAPGDAGQAYAHSATMAHPDYSVQQQQQQHHVAPAQFAAFGFGSSAPMGWDWTHSVDFADFTNQYEPQGELIQEYRNQINATNDFSVPLPVTSREPAYQPMQQNHSATRTPNATQLQKPPCSLPPPQSQQQKPVVQTGVKRKIESEPSSAVSQSGSTTVENPPKRINKSRQSSDSSATSPVLAAPPDPRPPPTTRVATAPTTDETAVQSTPKENTQAERQKEQSKGTGSQGRAVDVSKPRRVQEASGEADTLPAGKVFPIQIGSDLFRLSGASISSDAPSYFSHFFGQQLHDNGGRAGDVRTLYIDRDPDTFRDIALHLQGYHITPKDGEHFVKLYADAQFYSLPRLTKQLFRTDIFVRIGGTPFQIPRDLFSAPGDSPNYFSLGFAQFFSTPSEVFPGLDRNALLRPPSISPPSVPSRNGETFRELIQLLQGYNVDIRNDAHRSRLLRDARYFHLKGLEQKLIPCEISYNLKRQQSEILLRLEDIRQSGISFSPDLMSSDSESGSTAASPIPLSTTKVASPAPSIASSNAVSRAGYVCYARPYTDDHVRTNTLIMEISTTESTTLYLPSSAPQVTSSKPLEVNVQAAFHNSTLARITSLFSVIASKMGLPATQPLGFTYVQPGTGVAGQSGSPANAGVSEQRVRVRLDEDCALDVDGSPAEVRIDEATGRVGIIRSGHANKWLWGGDDHNLDFGRTWLPRDDDEWTIKRAHWRIRVEPVEDNDDDDDEGRMQVILCGVKIDAYTLERSRNLSRGFLGCNNS